LKEPTNRSHPIPEDASGGRKDLSSKEFWALLVLQARNLPVQIGFLRYFVKIRFLEVKHLFYTSLPDRKST